MLTVLNNFISKFRKKQEIYCMEIKLYFKEPTLFDDLTWDLVIPFIEAMNVYVCGYHSDFGANYTFQLEPTDEFPLETQINNLKNLFRSLNFVDKIVYGKVVDGNSDEESMESSGKVPN